MDGTGGLEFCRWMGMDLGTGIGLWWRMGIGGESVCWKYGGVLRWSERSAGLRVRVCMEYGMTMVMMLSLALLLCLSCSLMSDMLRVAAPRGWHWRPRTFSRICRHASSDMLGSLFPSPLPLPLQDVLRVLRAPPASSALSVVLCCVSVACVGCGLCDERLVSAHIDCGLRRISSACR